MPDPKRILLLDDDVGVRRAFARRARSFEGLVLEAVATPEEVRARLRAGPPPDLVVCDFQLKALGAGATSAQLVGELRREGQAVVVMTGDTSAALAVLDPGVTVLAKPLVLEALLEWLDA